MKQSIAWILKKSIVCVALLGITIATSEVALARQQTQKLSFEENHRLIARTQNRGASIRPVYKPTRNRLYREYERIFRKYGFLEDFASTFTRMFVLSRNLTMSLQECGVPAAQYNPRRSEITMCYELIELFRQDFLAARLPRNYATVAAIYTASFVMHHELAHALIDQFNLPVLGREEDAADEFAAVFVSSTTRGGVKLTLDTALQLFISSKRRPDQPLAWDEHSSSSQRFYRIACLAYGASPRYSGRVQGNFLSNSAKQQCINEYRQTERNWLQVLSPHFRRQLRRQRR